MSENNTRAVLQNRGILSFGYGHNEDVVERCCLSRWDVVDMKLDGNNEVSA
jgi:hypothetical protein